MSDQLPCLLCYLNKEGNLYQTFPAYFSECRFCQKNVCKQTCIREDRYDQKETEEKYCLTDPIPACQECYNSRRCQCCGTVYYTVPVLVPCQQCGKSICKQCMHTCTYCKGMFCWNDFIECEECEDVSQTPFGESHTHHSAGGWDNSCRTCYRNGEKRGISWYDE